MDSVKYEDILQKDTVVRLQWIKFACRGNMQKWLGQNSSDKYKSIYYDALYISAYSVKVVQWVSYPERK